MSNDSRRPNGGYFVEVAKSNPKAPSVRGKLTVNGEEYVMAGWDSEEVDRNGNKVKMVKFQIKTVAEDEADRQRRMGGGSPAPASAPRSTADTGAGAAAAGDFTDIFSAGSDSDVPF